MGKWLMRGLLLSEYCIPFGFLSMYGDVTGDTMLLCGFLIAGFGALYVSVVKSMEFHILIVGNILSFITSYSCVQQFHTDTWGWYFKPFTASGLLIVISVIALLVQLLFVYRSYQKQRTTCA